MTSIATDAGSVCVISVHHSGTNFVCEFIQKCRKRPWLNSVALRPRSLNDPNPRVHRRHTEPPFKELIEDITPNFPTVVPLRDPLTSMRSKAKRGKPYNAWWISEQMKVLAAVDQPHFHHFPIDLFTAADLEIKIKALTSLMEFVGGDADPFWIHQWAEEWPIISAAKKNKKPYDSPFEPPAPGSGAPTPFEWYYDLLRDNVGTLQPFLEGHGYEDLEWYKWR